MGWSSVSIDQPGNLSSEAEIRAMGQQLGAQMCGERNLSIRLPTFDISGGRPEEGEQGAIYKHYQVRFWLENPCKRIAAIPEDKILLMEASVQ